MASILNLRTSKASDLKNRKDRYIYRFFEMIPGILAWSTLISVVVFSFIAPITMAIFIIVFDVYWLLKTIYLSTHLRIAFKQVQANLKVDWLKKLKEVKDESITVPGVKSWQDITHLIFLPTYKEDEIVIGSTIDGLADNHYPKEKMIVVVAQEERSGIEHNEKIKKYIIEKYSDKFGSLVFIEHPSDIVGELAGKGSNISYAGKYIHENVVSKLNIQHSSILVSALDVDTIVYPYYFACLTYTYLTTKDPLHASYQPVPFYLNNVWDAPAISRISGFSTTFWQTVKQEQSDTMITYSSHSMPYTALLDVGFWQDNMVSEDSRIFWQCLLRYDGNYRVAPLYYPVTMDANLAPTYFRTLLNVYKQQRRWGYGSENIPYLLFGFLKNKNIPLKKKFYYSFVMLEGVWSWATNALMIFMLGWLPLLVGGPEFNTNVLSYNLPSMTKFMTTFAMFGLVTSAIFAGAVLPERPEKYGKMRHVGMFAQWLLFPVKSIFFGSFPALEAQTRLMLGKYMGFWVTPKSRK